MSGFLHAPSPTSRLEAMYEDYADTIYKYLLSLCHDPALAEDLMQDTFLLASRKIDTFRHDSSLSTWLCTIARNLFFDWQRKHPHTAEFQDPGKVQKISFDEDRLFDAIHHLEEPAREIVYLRMYGELSFARIGQMFGKSENWARVVFYRSKQKLRKELEKHEHPRS